MRSSRATRRIGTLSSSCCPSSMSSGELVVRQTDAVEFCCYCVFEASTLPLFNHINPNHPFSGSICKSLASLGHHSARWEINVKYVFQGQNDAVASSGIEPVTFPSPDTNETIAVTFVLTFPRNLGRKVYVE